MSADTPASSSRSSSARSSRSGWGIATLLTAGAIATGAWAFPHIQQAQEIQDGADPSFSAPAPSGAATPTATQTLTAGALDTQLRPIAESFNAGNISGTVTDAATGELLYSHRADAARIPASNFKILTDYTLMRHADPAARYTTAVKQAENTLTLVAGGDTLLGTGKSNEDLVVGHAGLQTLAQKTIDALAQQDQKNFVLNLDTSLYSGPAINSAWAQEDIDAGFVNNLAPIAFYSHYSPGADGRSTTSRPTQPAQEVQQHLLDTLNELGAQQGITFTLGKEKKADDGAATVAAVESATVSEQATFMMHESDNMLAEVLGRNAAIAAGKEGSEQAAKDLVRSTLEADGIPTEGLTQTDLCGLSMDNKVTHETLTQIVRAMVNGENGLSAALSGFPVAGGSGTLESRFDDSAEAAARGYARGKTGTLNKVIALTGYTERDNGQVLIYSFITNNVTDTAQAKNTIDRSVAVVTNQ